MYKLIKISFYYIDHTIRLRKKMYFEYIHFREIPIQFQFAPTKKETLQIFISSYIYIYWIEKTRDEKEESRILRMDSFCRYTPRYIDEVIVVTRTWTEESPWNANVIITVVTTARSRNLNWVSRLSGRNSSIARYLNGNAKERRTRAERRGGKV